MRTLDRYIARTVVGASLLVLVVLVAAFTFFTFVDEVQDVGRGRYGLRDAAGYVLFSVPGLCYEFFPIAALLGGLIGLGRLASQHEVAVMRAAGLSVRRLMGAVMLGAAVLVLAAVLIGEFLAPPAERFATSLRSIAISDEIVLRTRDGFWARDGNRFVNIQRLVGDDRVVGVSIHEFDDDRRLTLSTRAASARYRDGRWELEDIQQTLIREDGVERRVLATMSWESKLRPELIAMVTLAPSGLSVRELVSYLGFLRQNNQDASRYEQALWLKLTYPAATAAMLLLAVPLVLGVTRAGSLGARVVLGALIGLAFHIANQAAGNLGLLVGLPSGLAVSGPTLLVLAAGWALLRRVR